jgi:hypothetical protein
MANNTGLIVGVSVLGVAVVGVGIYLLTKKPTTTAPTNAALINPQTGKPYGQYVAPKTPVVGGQTYQQPVNQDSWWQNPLGQVGGNVLNKLVDNLFAPKSASTDTSGIDTSGSTASIDTSGYDMSGYDPYASDLGLG